MLTSTVSVENRMQMGMTVPACNPSALEAEKRELQVGDNLGYIVKTFSKTKDIKQTSITTKKTESVYSSPLLVSMSYACCSPVQEFFWRKSACSVNGCCGERRGS